MSLPPATNFNSLPVELQTMIASEMSPYDLAKFSHTGRLSRAIANRPNLYADALTRMNFPAHIPTPAASLAIFCLAFFGGGNCKVCGKYTDVLPFSYTARLRVCGGSCKDELIKQGFITTLPRPKTLKPKHILLNRVEPWMPFIETPIGRRTYYLRSALLRATTKLQDAMRLDARRTGPGKVGEQETKLLKAWERNALNLPGIMKTADDVLVWQKNVYQWKRQQLNENVSKRLSVILQMRGLSMAAAEVLRSPTLRFTIKAWHRDLQELSLHAFSVIQPIVLRESVLSQLGVPPPAFQYRQSDRIICPFCDTKKALPVDSLVLHIHHKHPEEFPRVRDTYNTTPRFKYCELCPNSLKKFEMAGKRKHFEAKHKE
ncbi:hypothetical protein C8R46DRAFT_180226 [Mycena filopes]|nr:hypothetical protein C8R46DRAFT_180226 [Mycena filopes]